MPEPRQPEASPYVANPETGEIHLCGGDIDASYDGPPFRFSEDTQDPPPKFVKTYPFIEVDRV